MRFITFETLVTGVRAFECAFSVRTSSFVHGLMTRRAVVAFTVWVDYVVLTAFFKALGIIQVLHVNAAQIGTRCGDKKTDALTYSILSDNWYVVVLPPVEEEIRRVIRNERAKDAAHRSVRSWGHGRPGRGVTPSAKPATSPSICGSEATARCGDETPAAVACPARLARDRLESTYSGRSRPRPLTPQLGGPLPFAGRQDWAGHLPSPSSEGDCWITRVPAAKASDSAFIVIYTITLWMW